MERAMRIVRLVAASGGTARGAGWIAFASSVLLILVTLPVPQGIDSDPGWQLRAVQQFERGESPTPNTMTMPDAADLSRDRTAWISLWTPGPVILAYLPTRLGVSIGTSVRIIVAISLVLGAVMWARWCALFGLPAALVAWLAAVFPWMRYASNGLFVFIAETLVFAIAPCVFLAAHAVGSRWREGKAAGTAQAVGTGALFGWAYILKDSTLLATSGLGLCLGVIALRGAATRQRLAARILVECTVLGATFAAGVFGLSALNRMMGAVLNVVTGTLSPTFQLEHLVAAVAVPPMIFGDLNALLHAILTPPSQPGVSPETILLVGLPAAAVVVWVVARERAHDLARNLALAALASTTVVLATLWNLADVSFDARHVAMAGLGVLPLGLRAGLAQFRKSGPAMKVILAGTAAVFVFLPQVYGVLSVPVKVARYRHGYAAGMSGVYDPTFAASNVPACRAQLIKAFDAAHDVWYAIDPSTSLDLPGRVLIAHADFLDLDWLQKLHYQTTQPLVMHVLLPGRFEREGKGAVIRASFAGAGAWTERKDDECNIADWQAAIAPTPIG
jgi:hypothetical protein